MATSLTESPPPPLFCSQFIQVASSGHSVRLLSAMADLGVCVS